MYSERATTCSHHDTDKKKGSQCRRKFVNHAWYIQWKCAALAVRRPRRPKTNGSNNPRVHKPRQVRSSYPSYHSIPSQLQVIHHLVSSIFPAHLRSKGSALIFLYSTLL